MKPLYLCYDDMPCHLKQCFLYCSLFLSDFAVDRRSLVQQWIAEGFVQIRGDAAVEEVADDYYDELIGRNLLQPAEADRHGCVERCTMHDMLRSMAQALSRGENFTGDAQRPPDDGDGDASFAPRHVSLPRNHLGAIPEEVLKLEGVRTLLLQRNPLTIESNIFTRLLHLKVLDLTETAMEVIPETLGNLLYLRFLNLSNTRIKALPETIGNLWSLKFLLLRQCKALHVLPKGIEHLKGLRDLDLTDTVISDAAFRIGHLRSLTSIRCFTVASKEERGTNDRSGWPLDELKNLTQLRTLHVKKLEKATSHSEAAEVALLVKTGLRELELSCSGTVKTFQIPTAVRNIEDIFRELKPPRCLESLKIVNYFGTKFPTWLSSICLPNLIRLNITGCNFCQSFPPLGCLPELRSLCIADSSALKDIDAQFMDTDHSHKVPFPKLEDLHFQGLHNLETWTSIEAGALPCLQAMQLESCPKLRCLPDGLRHVTSMTELRIVDMESLEAVENIAAVRELSIWNTPNLKRVCNLPSLEDLDICHCPSLETVENINKLQELHIFDHELQEMPRWIETHAPKLSSLEFMSTTNLLKRCLVDGPDWPIIKDIVQVHGYSNDSSYIYYSKNLNFFEGSASILESLDAEECVADSGEVDDISMDRRKIYQEDGPVSSPGTSTSERNGFFDQISMQTETARSEDNAPDMNFERFMTRPTSHRLPKLEEVPEEDEDEEGADPEVLVPVDTTKSDTVPEKLHRIDTHVDNDKAGSKVKRDAPTDDKSLPETVKHIPMKVTKSNENKSPDSLACSRQKISKKEKDAAADADTLTVANCPSTTITESHPDKVNKITASVTAIKNDDSIPEHTPGKEVPTKSAGANHQGSQTVPVTETAQDLHSSLHHGEPQLPDFVDDTCTSISDNRDETDSNNTSLPANLNLEESKASVVAKTLACKQQTADPGDGADTSIKKLANIITKKVSNNCSAESFKWPSTKTIDKIAPSSSPPISSKSHAIDNSTASKKLEANLKNRFSAKASANDGLTDDKTPVIISVKASDAHQPPPKVYTAIWADTDTDTLKARFVSTMQHYRRMASHRRRRHRKHGSSSKWSISPVLVAVLLFVSMAQLMFTFWMYRKLLNQSSKEKASAFSSVGSSSSGKSGGGEASGGTALIAAALFKRFNSSVPQPRAEAASASAGVAEVAGDGDGGVRLEIEEIAAGDRCEKKKRKTLLVLMVSVNLLS
uniref:Uncharacterized protein n=1 Tax=Oryza brachyantha TaxID=4533 RepID=J3N3D0_ORYBR